MKSRMNFLAKSLTIVTILCICQAVAAIQLSRPNLKLVTCEALLKNVGKYSAKESVLPILREAIYQIQKAIPNSGNDGTAFSDLKYSGTLSKLPTKQARAIIQRLNGIEKNLTSTNLDSQIFAFEIRGDDIQKALADIAVDEARLKNIYGTMIPQRMHLAMFGLDVFYFQGAFRDAFHLMHGLAHIGHEPLTAAIFPVVFSAIYIPFIRSLWAYNRERYDWTFSQLTDFLSRAQINVDPNRILVSSSQIRLPIEFHKMLINTDDSSVDQARQIGADQFGSTYMWRQTRRYLTFGLCNDLARDVCHAGDKTRNIFIDHIVYFDPQTKQPVWLFFYRAFRKQPAGRKPSKKDVRETKRDVDWTPGLKPVLGQ